MLKHFNYLLWCVKTFLDRQIEHESILFTTHVKMSFSMQLWSTMQPRYGNTIMMVWILWLNVSYSLWKKFTAILLNLKDVFFSIVILNLKKRNYQHCTLKNQRTCQRNEPTQDKTTKEENEVLKQKYSNQCFCFSQKCFRQKKVFCCWWTGNWNWRLSLCRRWLWLAFFRQSLSLWVYVIYLKQHSPVAQVTWKKITKYVHISLATPPGAEFDTPQFSTNLL